MKRRMIAILLALTLLLAALPVSAGAAANTNMAVKGKKASVSVGDNGVWLTVKWNKVSGATGYEYAYNLFWKKSSSSSSYKVGTTNTNSAKIRLRDYGTISFRVRAYRKVGDKKVYGKWSTGKLKSGQVDKMVLKKLQQRMKSKDLFLRAKKSLDVRADAGEKYGVVAKLNRLDEVRATGKIKRDSKGVWWAQVYASIDQNTTVKGWVSRKATDMVWY